MSEFPWTSIFTIIGVIVGFSLSQGADLIKNERSKRTIKRALLNELSVVRNSLSIALNNDSRLPRERLPLVTETYDLYKGKLPSILNPNQLALIQKAYLQIKQVGTPMSSGTTLMRGYIEIPSDGVIYEHDLNDEIKLLEQAINELN